MMLVTYQLKSIRTYHIDVGIHTDQDGKVEGHRADGVVYQCCVLAYASEYFIAAAVGVPVYTPVKSPGLAEAFAINFVDVVVVASKTFVELIRVLNIPIIKEEILPTPAGIIRRDDEHDDSAWNLYFYNQNYLNLECI